VLLVAGGIGRVVLWSNTRSNIEVTKLQVFDGTSGKVSEFIIACKLFLRMREVAV